MTVDKNLLHLSLMILLKKIHVVVQFYAWLGFPFVSLALLVIAYLAIDQDNGIIKLCQMNRNIRLIDLRSYNMYHSPFSV